MRAPVVVEVGLVGERRQAAIGDPARAVLALAAARCRRSARAAGWRAPGRCASPRRRAGRRWRGRALQRRRLRPLLRGRRPTTSAGRSRRHRPTRLTSAATAIGTISGGASRRRRARQSIIARPSCRARQRRVAPGRAGVGRGRGGRRRCRQVAAGHRGLEEAVLGDVLRRRLHVARSAWSPRAAR